MSLRASSIWVFLVVVVLAIGATGAISWGAPAPSAPATPVAPATPTAPRTPVAPSTPAAPPPPAAPATPAAPAAPDQPAAPAAPRVSAVKFQTVDTGQNSSVQDPTRVVVRDAAAWAELWRRHVGPAGRSAPAVDFNREMVVAVFAGVSQDSSGLWINKIVRETERLTVFYSLVDSKPVPLSQNPVVVKPFHIVRVPRSSAQVWFALVVTKR